MEKPAKSRIASIDAIRALAVFGVVIIHCDLFRKAGFGDNWRLAGSLIDLASRVAVPFFMVAAGYFFGIKSREQCFGVAIVSTFARRLFIVFSFWYVFYIFWPADWRLAIDQGYWRTIYWDANALLHHTARLVIGPRAHLWFLSALLLGTIHVALIGRIAGWRLLMPYSVILYLLGLAYGAYQAIPEVNAVSPRLWGNLAFPPFSSLWVGPCHSKRSRSDIKPLWDFFCWVVCLCCLKQFGCMSGLRSLCQDTICFLGHHSKLLG